MACRISLLLALSQLVFANPAPARVAAVERALVTPPPVYDPAARRDLQKKNIISDISSLASEAASYGASLASSLGVSSDFASGIVPYFQGYPTGSDVLKKANVSSTDLDAQPTQALNIP